MDRRKASRSKNDQDMRQSDGRRRDRTSDMNRQRDKSIKSRHVDREEVDVDSTQPSSKKVVSKKGTTTKTRMSDIDQADEKVIDSRTTAHMQSKTSTTRLQTEDVRHRVLEQTTSKRPSKKDTPSTSTQRTVINAKTTGLEKTSRGRNFESVKKSKDRSNSNVDDRDVHVLVPLRQSSRTVIDELKRPTSKHDDVVDSMGSKGLEDVGEYEEDFEDYESDFEDPVNDNDDDNEQEMSDHDDDVEVEAEHLILRRDSEMIEIAEKFSNEASSSLIEHRLSTDELASSVVPIESSRDDASMLAPDQMGSVVLEQQTTSRTTIREKNPDKPLATNLIIESISTKDKQDEDPRLKNKAKKRGEELLDLIKLDNVGFGLFSLPPRPYDDFMRRFGNDNSKQAYTQTGDENESEETQTDLVEMSDVWTQHPPGNHGAVGGNQLTTKQRNVYEITSSKDWKRLGRFLHQASQIMCCLLEEEHGDTQDSKLVSIEKEIGFSEKTLHLRPPLFLQGYSALFVSSCKLQPHFILVIYAKVSPEPNNVSPDQKRIICVWNVNQPSAPQRVLTNSCQALCCCFSQTAEFIFAGLEDGSVAVWDLREPDNLHHRFSCDGDEYVFRSPTYSTAEVLGSEGHLSAVVAILCRADNNSTYRSSSGSTHSRDDIIEVATVEEDGVLCVWVLSETSHPDVAGDETNLGLAPGGKVQLVKSSSVRLQNRPKLQQHLQTYPRVKDFACQAQDANRFYVATDTGVVVTCTVHDEKSTIYVPSEGTSAIAEANSISFAINSEPQCFLVGCDDGSVRLHSVAKAKPLMTWTAASKAGEAIHKVAWSQSCPNVFYLLDCLGQFHVWDLCESDCEPASSTNAANKRVRHFDVGSDKRLWNETDTTYKPYIVFGCDDGTTEVHYVNERYTRRGDKEKQMFRKYVELL